MRTELERRVRFFQDNAGYCTPPGRMQCALELAMKEEQAEELGLEVVWEYESDADLSWADKHTLTKIENGEYEVLCAHVPDETGRHSLASLGNIVVSVNDRKYRRVVEAELFQEAIDTLLKGN